MVFFIWQAIVEKRRPDSSGCFFIRRLETKFGAYYKYKSIDEERMGTIGTLIVALPLVFILPRTTQAQDKKIAHYNQVWFAYLNQTRFTDKWGLWVDAHLRTKEDFFTAFSQSILRLGVTYYLNDVTKLAAGYAYVSNYPVDNHENVKQPEHRVWQQIQWHNKYAKIRSLQWFRLEEKYKRKILNDSEPASGYTFNYKMRYNYYMQAPLSKKGIQPGTFSFVVNDEVHINFGKQIVYNYFDQPVFPGLCFSNYQNR